MNTDVSHNELLSAAQNGDSEAFESLVREYYHMVYQFSYKFCLNHHEAEDITQDVFVKVARALKGFKGDARFSTWLYKVTLSVYSDAQRKKRHYEDIPEHLHDEQSSGIGESSESVKHALAKLPIKQRQAIILTYYEGLTHAEAAEAMSCSETTISWRVFNAKKKLSVYLRHLK